MSDTPKTDAETMSNGVETLTSQSDSVALYQKLCDAVCEIQGLRRERDELRRMSVMEMMGENLNVLHHVTEWENRCLKAEQERDEALMDRANGDIATMTRNHYERLLRERNEHICSFSKDIMGDCIICKKELGEDTFEQDGAKFKLHKECITEKLQVEINQLLRPLQYKKDGKLIFSYVHKEKEVI